MPLVEEQPIIWPFCHKLLVIYPEWTGASSILAATSWATFHAFFCILSSFSFSYSYVGSIMKYHSPRAPPTICSVSVNCGSIYNQLQHCRLQSWYVLLHSGHYPRQLYEHKCDNAMNINKQVLHLRNWLHSCLHLHIYCLTVIWLENKDGRKGVALSYTWAHTFKCSKALDMLRREVPGQ